jgi:hypothetical protein
MGRHGGRPSLIKIALPDQSGRQRSDNELDVKRLSRALII